MFQRQDHIGFTNDGSEMLSFWVINLNQKWVLATLYSTCLSIFQIEIPEAINGQQKINLPFSMENDLSFLMLVLHLFYYKIVGESFSVLELSKVENLLTLFRNRICLKLKTLYINNGTWKLDPSKRLIYELRWWLGNSKCDRWNIEVKRLQEANILFNN